MEKIKPLSRREKEVIDLLLQGKGNKQIALSLGISERTVEFHLKNIYAKLQVNSRVELILKLGKATGGIAENPRESTVDNENDKVHNGKQPTDQSEWARSLENTFSTIKKEFAMTKEMRTILVAVLVLLGLGLMIGGIITGKNGAVVVGLCVAAAAAQQIIVMRKPTKQGENESQKN
jgi:DNA-binding CsgD family transcriptional regulator